MRSRLVGSRAKTMRYSSAASASLPFSLSNSARGRCIWNKPGAEARSRSGRARQMGVKVDTQCAGRRGRLGSRRNRGRAFGPGRVHLGAQAGCRAAMHNDGSNVSFHMGATSLSWNPQPCSILDRTAAARFAHRGWRSCLEIDYAMRNRWRVRAVHSVLEKMRGPTWMRRGNMSNTDPGVQFAPARVRNPLRFNSSATRDSGAS